MRSFGCIAGLLAGPLWVLLFGALQFWGSFGWGLMIGLPIVGILLTWLYKPLQIRFWRWFTIGWLIGAAGFSTYILATFAYRFT
ncbi:hypothetical protein B5M42_003355 [Paenibacillus athensensis]|uniref:Uncharacterized protein n=1 Tax=Paenibacillus athensensis TaxID=1967502 RepID=A0A4Y8PWT3_9BACL|nr:hypothetical protein [Paenibacillus athensensis]MCD1257877.1 hypothetical protein [Paenibacillus athensensis]